MTGNRAQGTHRGQTLWPLIQAPLVWATHFLLAYGTASVWCAKTGADPGTLRWMIGGFTLIALTLIALVAWCAWREWSLAGTGHHDHAGSRDEDRRRFLGHARFLLAGVSAVAVIYVTLPAFLAGGCT